MEPSRSEVETRVLLVDSDAELRRSLAQRLRKRNCVVASAGSAESALKQLRSERFDLVVADVFMQGVDGLEFLRELKAVGPDAEVVVVSGRLRAADSAEALKLGAFDVLDKPCRPERLIAAVTRACELVRLRRENIALKAMTGTPDVEIVGTSPAAARVRERVDRCAAAGSPVLIEGESGTEKELVARAIWVAGTRRDRPFVTFEAAGADRELAAVELFGQQRGTSAGATADREGLLEAAHGGTVFVDEVGELELPVQTELLRLIEQGELRRVGSTRVRHVDVRLIAATSRGLERETEEGRFSRALFYRLGPPRIVVAPLRERLEDVPLLVAHVLRNLPRAGGPRREVTEEAMRLLQGYNWPGNTRELANVLERAAMLSEGREITAGEMGPMVAGAGSPAGALTLEEHERRHVARVLRQAGGNKSEAARLLGIGRRRLYHLIERLGLERDVEDASTAPAGE